MVIRLIIGALMIGSVYGVVGIGYGLIYKASGLMSLAQGDMLMFGAFLGITFYKYLQLPFIIALLLTMIIMFMLGMFIERVMVTKLIEKGAQTVYIILCTISISMILQNSSMLTWGSNVLQFPAIFNSASVKIFGVSVAPENLLVLGVGIIIMVALQLFLTKTKFGISMRAAAQDEVAASALGINVPLTKGTAWGIASMLAGAIGVVVGPVFGVYMSMGAMIGQKAFAGAVVGGYGNMFGAIIGGVFFGFLETFVSAYLTSNYKDFITFGILIIVMILMPKGIFNEEVME
ncbi:branched-chain amino acid ABC transporter permease [Anaerocolumna aminovalerica]|jgi:branched-chain amino acid transport system permease protein|uniref:Amino acid/amide ABC transporter membrane protein 1, HAAT family n=1 Tax=Anaerocolumna aminovalerica TaxID=1527 RepID=A0A1I5GNU2_9FIRM|nr:branched-chain amino acid ABC transporter permease [Anaerocolumna aminovalerica]MBU5331192.1 branched-chain amino acid ABC transporter permease [Anaerocolumna aminovalerica]MDU6263228.1 branched-chain amino acid ABC transporter permease [Anaerocolumna aminovalerica]SFO37744.1 amino acid/amide ABC transporter membrane protein 1, HAAT family [Anaerocolumna aminovalerica]